MSFVHLDVHSNYSLLSGASTIEELVERAAVLDMPALALTDTDGMYGVVPFVEACRKAGIKPIPGVELSAGGERAVVLPRNISGYRELCRLVTTRHLDPAFTLEGALRESSEELFILTSSVRLLRALSGRRNVFVALDAEEGTEARQRRYFLASLAEKLSLRTIATNRVHFAKREGYGLHRILAAIRTRRTVGTLPPGEVVPPSCYLKSAAEMEGALRGFPEAMETAGEVAWMCDVELELGIPRPPHFEPPPGESCYSYLASLAFEGLKRRVGPFGREEFELLARELDVIERLGMASYFLVCWDIVRFARERGMPTLGRGSAANSMVSYCLWITHLNPRKHNLFFERFLNLERATPPDFDLDFGTEDREEVLRYIFSKYGNERTAMVSTIVTMRARSAMRETAKALGIPEKEIEGVVRRIPHFADPERLEEELPARPDTRHLPIAEEPFATILAIARKMAGFPRHLATHPCGLVIAPEPVADLVPLEMGEKGFPITQWTMYPIEDAGLIKVDIIGQKGLAVIRDTIRAVERNYSIEVRSEAIDYLGDPKAKALMREGKTEGAFYIESPVMQQLLKQARCEDFEVLTALSSIIRPGVSNYGGKQEYLMRYLGRAPVTYPHPALERVLRDTFGCLIYQEQVIQTAVALAGMTLAEADGLRLCMSKKRNWEKMGSYKERFFVGARERGVPEEVIENVFSQIESFAGYAFCKAHSASFAVESFESLYWKAHYPAEFMAAVLSNQGGYYSTMEYVEEARRMGLAILPPCVNRSRVEYWGRGREIRVGLMQVKELKRESMERIVSEREREGEYRSVADLAGRVPLDRRELENLGRCGALDSLGGTRPEILWQVELLLAEGDKGSVGSQMADPRELLGRLPRLEELSFEERTSMELEYLGFSVSSHPFALFRREIERVKRARPVVASTDIAEYVGRRIYCLGWKVTVKHVRTEKEERLMAFITFSDELGRVEAVFFPEGFERCAEELSKGDGPFLMLGRVEENLGATVLDVERVHLIKRDHSTAALRSDRPSAPRGSSPDAPARSAPSHTSCQARSGGVD